jgi:hypothetical protein
MQGRGCFTTSGKEVYEGNFYNNDRNGHGTCQYSDGEVRLCGKIYHRRCRLTFLFRYFLLRSMLATGWTARDMARVPSRHSPVGMCTLAIGSMI